jgi:hypothetical protein
MGKTPEPAGHDRMRNCHQARWHRLSGYRAEFGIKGLDVCAALEADSNDANSAWSYSMFCFADRRRARGRGEDRDACIWHVLFWLRTVDCPGRLEETPKPDVTRAGRVPRIFRRLIGPAGRRPA